MLVLTRQVDEELVIGDQIRIKVLGVDGKSARLGIEAPREVPVHRAEVHQQIIAQNRAAAEAAQQTISLTGAAGTRALWTPSPQHCSPPADRESNE